MTVDIKIYITVATESNSLLLMCVNIKAIPCTKNMCSRYIGKQFFEMETRVFLTGGMCFIVYDKAYIAGITRKHSSQEYQFCTPPLNVNMLIIIKHTSEMEPAAIFAWGWLIICLKNDETTIPSA